MFFRRMVWLIIIAVGCTPNKIEDMQFIPDKEEVKPIVPAKQVFEPSSNEEASSIHLEHPNAVLYFMQDGCYPCKQQKPILDEIIQENSGVTFIIVDANLCRQFSTGLKVAGTPTIIIKDKRFSGLATKQEIQREIDERL